MSTISKETVTLEKIRSMRTATITRIMAADALGVDPRTVTAGIAEGNIPGIKLGRRVVIPREKFLRLFDVEAG